MRVLIGCECSGVVRDAFLALGHDAWSCDLKPSETPGPHLQCDVFDVLDDNWDLGIFHPECTYLTCSRNGLMAMGHIIRRLSRERWWEQLGVPLGSRRFDLQNGFGSAISRESPWKTQLASCHPNLAGLKLYSRISLAKMHRKPLVYG